MAELIQREDTLNTGREKLNNAIKAFNETVVEGDSSVEAAQARVDSGGKIYNTLKERLDDKDTEFSSQITQTMYELDSTKDKVKGKRDKSQPVDLNELTPRTLAAIEGGEGTSFNIESIPRDFSVTQQKTTFTKKGKNLFDGIFERGIVLLGPTNNVHTVAKRSSGYSAIINVSPNTTYYISKKGGSSDRFGISESASYPKEGDELNVLNSNSNLSGVKVTTASDTRYLIVYLSSTTEDKKPEEFQVEKSSYQTSYESPNKVIVDFVDRSIDVTALKNVTPIGLLTGGHNNFNVDLLNKKITTIGAGGFINVGGNRYYLKDGDFSYNHISTNSVIVFFDPSNSDILFNTISGSIEDGFKNLPIIGQIRQTGNNCDFYGNYQINGQNVIPFTETQSGGKRFYIDDSLEGLYRANIEYESPWDITIDVVYNILDNLVSLYPNYITRTLLFNDSSGLPVYLYKFKPESVRVNGSSRELPKISVTSTHGFEVPAIMGTTKFFEDLANNWEKNDLLRTLRWNVEFDYVPTLNPYGFNTRERKNANGVDLARNFSAGWNQEGENGNPESVYYAGPSPLSEVETQGYNEYINNNQDVLFAIDVHNYTNLEVSGTVLWAGSNNSDIRNYLGGYVTKMSSMVQQNYNIPVGYENKLLGLVQGATGGSLTTQWESVGVNASLLELVSDFSTNNTDVQEFSASAVGNLALAGLKNLI